MGPSLRNKSLGRSRNSTHSFSHSTRGGFEVYELKLRLVLVVREKGCGPMYNIHWILPQHTHTHTHTQTHRLTQTFCPIQGAKEASGQPFVGSHLPMLHPRTPNSASSTKVLTPSSAAWSISSTRSPCLGCVLRKTHGSHSAEAVGIIMCRKVLFGKPQEESGQELSQ